MSQSVNPKYIPSGGFFGIQISQNSISAGALSCTPLGELPTPPNPLVGYRWGIPLLSPSSTP